jgi:ankyrin repeat protein
MSAHDGPLRNAASNGEVTRVAELLSLGADPNILNHHGDTALVMAANNGHADVVRVLLQHGANPFLSGHGRMTSLGAAISNRHLETAELLLHSCRNSPREWLFDGLYWSIISAEPAMVRAVLEAGADLGPGGENGKTALDTAKHWMEHATDETCRLNYKEIITILDQHIRK